MTTPLLPTLLLASLPLASSTPHVATAGPDDAPVAVRVEIGGRAYAGRLELVAPPPTTRPTSRPAGDVRLLDAGPAPLGVHLDAADAIDPARLRTTRVSWDFGDRGAAHDALDGYNAAHVYDVPGTYAIRRTVETPAGRATTHYRVEVRHDARRTIHVSADGDDRNDGRSPERPMRTFAFATAALDGGNAQVLFRRGDAFEVGRPLLVRGDDVRLGAYGDPARPRPVLASTPAMGGATLVTVSGRRFLAEELAFDAPRAAPFEKAGTAIVFRAPGAVGFVVRRCTFLNVGTVIDGNGRPDGVLLQDNALPLEAGLRGYLAWCEGSDWTILGNRAANSTREHIVRVGGTDRVNVQHNAFANLDRRAAQADPDKNDTAKTTLNIQKGTALYVAHNRLDATLAVGPLGGNDGARDRAARWVGAVIEDNAIAATVEVHHGASHVTLRGNRLRADDRTAVLVERFDAAYARGTSDVTIESNAATNAGKTGAFLVVERGATGVGVYGNTYAAPELVTGAYAAAAIDAHDPDLRAFAGIAGNTWPTARPNAWAKGGVMSVGGAYVDAAAWARLVGPAGGDRFADVAIADAEIEAAPASGAKP